MQVYKLSESCSVAAQIDAADVGALKQHGYTVIVCNRPDGEDRGQPTAVEIAAECERHGVTFHHLPFVGNGIPADVVEEFQRIVAECDEQVLAYCRSGQRSSVLWQYSGSP